MIDTIFSTAERKNKSYFDNLDGLRVIGCLAIIAMHIRANTNYQISNIIYDIFIPMGTNFVYLFLMISGFGMFCGYYEAFKSKNIDLDIFYRKRYKKILPFLSLLILIDLLVDFSVPQVIEALTELTLVFGLLPNNELSVIGVAWTLGIIFLFYMLFPYIVYLCWTPKRAWVSFIVSLIISLFCSSYFFTEKFVIKEFTPRHNFLYCIPFFIGGGILYLYRNKIIRSVSKHRWISLFFCMLITALYFIISIYIKPVIDFTVINNIVFFSSWMLYAISINSRILNNSIMTFLSGTSLELYLSHMVIFRGFEKLGLLNVFGKGWSGFIITWIFVIFGSFIFISCL